MARGFDLLAIAVDERVEDLVDQAHRHELAGLGVHRLARAAAPRATFGKMTLPLAVNSASSTS